MKSIKFLFSVLMSLFLIGAFCSGVDQLLGIPKWVTATAFLSGQVIKAKYFPSSFTHVVQAGVQVEFWTNYIVERFWKDNQFIKNTFNENQFVVGGKIVHIPQPGAKPTVVKNRSSFPAAAVRRTDTDIVYILDEYTTDPTHVQDAEKVELSYSKIDSVLGDHAAVVNETVANDILYKWGNLLPQSFVVQTSGALAPATHNGQVGNRRKFTHVDLRKLALKFDLMDVPSADRYVLLDAIMYDEFMESLSDTQSRDFSKYYDAAKNIVGELYGFKIMKRSTVAMSAAGYNGSNQVVLNALGAATLATDVAVSIAWHKNALTHAMGEVKFFENVNDPQYYGDIYSALLRMGGRRRKEGSEGVAMIKQASA